VRRKRKKVEVPLSLVRLGIVLFSLSMRVCCWDWNRVMPGSKVPKTGSDNLCLNWVSLVFDTDRQLSKFTEI
jgi:hypothetical protein